MSLKEKALRRITLDKMGILSGVYFRYHGQTLRGVPFMNNYLDSINKIHLVGIGGVGMTGLAFLLREKGFVVSGSDIKEGYNIDLLKKESFEVCIGHRKSNVYGANLVCYSSAVKDDNIELKEAKAKNIKVLKRAELLALISRGAKNIVVSGSHGKTTTSALAAFVLTGLNYNPNVFIGSVALNFGKYAWSGEDLFVFEADESDGSFLAFKPWITVITNIDREHLDFYGDFNNLCDSFRSLADKTSSIIVGCGDDENVRSILDDRNSISYGLGESNYIGANNLRFYNEYTVFDLNIGSDKFKDVKVSLLGAHNVLNTLAVISLCVHLNENPDKFIPFLYKFKGTRRRFQLKGKVNGITFVDDYAHHPREIAATLDAAKQLASARIVVVFQPHRYSRIKLLYKEFARCFRRCDCLIITDIYPAGELPIEGVDGFFLYREIQKNFSGNTAYIPKERLIYDVPNFLKDGDLVMGLGAGDINVIMRTVMDKIRDKEDIKV